MSVNLNFVLVLFGVKIQRGLLLGVSSLLILYLIGVIFENLSINEFDMNVMLSISILVVGFIGKWNVSTLSEKLSRKGVNERFVVSVNHIFRYFFILFFPLMISIGQFLFIFLDRT